MARTMARILRHFTNKDHDDRGVKSNRTTYRLFLYRLVQTIMLFICRFIVVYILVTPIEKNSIIAGVSPLSVDASTTNGQTSKKILHKNIPIFLSNVEFYAL